MQCILEGHIDKCRMPRFLSSQDWDSVCSQRFEDLLSTRGGPYRLLLPLPCPPASISPGEGLPGGLLEGSCGRRQRRSMRNRLNAGTFMPTSSEGGVGKNFDCIYDNRYQCCIYYSLIICRTSYEKGTGTRFEMYEQNDN